MISIIQGPNHFAVVLDMKPSIPETGTVIRLEDDNAIIVLNGGQACKGCGAAKIGLCRAGGNANTLKAKNHKGAHVGDTVTIGIDETVKWKGYALSFIIPIASLIAGTILWHIIGWYLSLPSIEIPGGMTTMFVVSAFSFRKLHILDSTSSMAIKRIVTDYGFCDNVKSYEEIGYGI